MKIAIRYITKTGNTKKLADTIGTVTNIEPLTLDHKLTEDVDILFLGSSVMAARPRKEVKAFIAGIDVKIGQIINFSTAAIIDSTYKSVKKLVLKRNLEMSRDEFHCPGNYGIRYKNRPNEDDLLACAEFTREVIKKYSK